MFGAKRSRLRPKHGQVSGSLRSFRLCAILSRLSQSPKPPRIPSNVAKMPLNAMMSFDTLNRPSLAVRSVFGTAAGKLAEAGVEIQGYECRCGAPFSGCAGVTSIDDDKRRPPSCLSQVVRRNLTRLIQFSSIPDAVFGYCMSLPRSCLLCWPALQASSPLTPLHSSHVSLLRPQCLFPVF